MDKETIKYLISALRSATITWKGRTDCMNKNRRKKVIGKMLNGKDKTIWENNCEECDKYFPLKDKLLEIDHREAIGPFKGNWDEYIKRMFCGPENLQRLCIECHLRKTNIGNSTLLFERKNLLQDPLDFL
jgi:hypothetical protein